MSTTDYKRLNHIYYDVAWSIVKDGARTWSIRLSFSKTPDKALEETKECILLSNQPDFEMKVVGVRFV
jgi:hypothetical protein